MDLLQHYYTILKNLTKLQISLRRRGNIFLTHRNMLAILSSVTAA